MILFRRTLSLVIALASGAYASLPAPSFKAMGSSPKIVASEVISTGRKRMRHARATAARLAMVSPQYPGLVSLASALGMGQQ